MLAHHSIFGGIASCCILCVGMSSCRQMPKEKKPYPQRDQHVPGSKMLLAPAETEYPSMQRILQARKAWVFFFPLSWTRCSPQGTYLYVCCVPPMRGGAEGGLTKTFSGTARGNVSSSTCANLRGNNEISIRDSVFISLYHCWSHGHGHRKSIFVCLPLAVRKSIKMALLCTAMYHCEFLNSSCSPCSAFAACSMPYSCVQGFSTRRIVQKKLPSAKVWA
jgi:hypothetical protein